MDADFSGDKGSIQHDHDLSQGYSKNCAACKQEVEGTAEHLKILLVLYASPRLSNVRHRLEMAIRALEKAQAAFDEIGFEINVAEWDHLRASPRELADLTRVLRDRFPTRSKELISRPIEFVMACYADTYDILPAPYLVPDESGKEAFAHINNSTQFILDCWNRARDEALKDMELELKLFPPMVRRYEKQVPALGADSQRTMQKILKKWGNNPPRPQDVFSYDGDISAWSGE